MVDRKVEPFLPVGGGDPAGGLGKGVGQEPELREARLVGEEAVEGRSDGLARPRHDRGQIGAVLHGGRPVGQKAEFGDGAVPHEADGRGGPAGYGVQ
jgi:hypothetical protein